MRPRGTARKGAPPWIAAAVPTIAGRIDASNKIAWDARIHSTIRIEPRPVRSEKRFRWCRGVRPGPRVRKTVYRLTHEGWVQAMKLRTRFQGDIVEVLAPSLDPTPMRVSEIPEIFPAYVNLTAAVSLVRGGRLDFTRLHGIGSGAVAPVLWGDTLRRLGRLFGRAEESRTLDAWAASPAAVLIVTGIAGIGKSTLVASWLVRQRPRPYIYWFEVHDGTTRAVFLRDLAAPVGLLRAKGCAGAGTALERAAGSARGHPILLSFAAQTGSSVTGEMTRYLEREIWRTLTKDERTVLEASSLFRGLVPLDALHCFSDNWQLAIHGLQTKNLLAPTISGGVVVHDTIRDYIRERLPEVRRRSFHGLAAVYFFDGSEMRDRIEGMHHMLEAGGTKAFGEYLVSHGQGLLVYVHASELLRVLQHIGD